MVVEQTSRLVAYGRSAPYGVLIKTSPLELEGHSSRGGVANPRPSLPSNLQVCCVLSRDSGLKLGMQTLRAPCMTVPFLELPQTMLQIFCMNLTCARVCVTEPLYVCANRPNALGLKPVHTRPSVEECGDVLGIEAKETRKQTKAKTGHWSSGKPTDKHDFGINRPWGLLESWPRRGPSTRL